ncbi:peptidoglycan D,D-transpeptidase MrdA [Abditibacteriota bacterium]|nr:peptidoglycan D,D-transpeptidase MrdA [Abditibacteriota bacterium]
MATVFPPSGSVPELPPGWEVERPMLLRRRAQFWTLGLLVCFGAMAAKLYSLQVVQGASYVAQAKRNRLARVSIRAPRGVILGRHGEILATTQALHAVSVVPALLPSGKSQKEDRAKLLKTLAYLIHSTPQAIEDIIKSAREKKGARYFDPIQIATNLDMQTVARLTENRPRLDNAILLTDDLRRIYPRGDMAGHELGFTQIADDNDVQRAQNHGTTLHSDDRVGKSGIERYYDHELQGTRGEQLFEVDAQSRPVALRGRTAERAGATVQLSLDPTLQRAAENALAAARNSGAIAAVDPRNGEVLALASRPGYDPNIFSLTGKQFQNAYLKIARDPKHPMLNRAVTSRFPPGSTFKPIVASAGLEHGAVSPYSSVSCPGYFVLGRRFGCWSVHGGGVNLQKALALSCDVYFYQLGLKLGNPESSGPTYLAEVARRFGLGAKTGIDLSSDEGGLMPDPAWRKQFNAKRPSLQHWYPGNTLNMSIGQGDVLVTPLQMAVATAAIANGGTKWTPRLVTQIRDASGKLIRQTKPVGQSVGISPRNLSIVRNGMRYTVTNGTGKPCNLPQVSVAGKTGSAEDVHSVLPHSWWVCYAPAENPRIAIAVIVENSGHGSENALPVARAVLNAAFPVGAKPAA